MEQSHAVAQQPPAPVRWFRVARDFLVAVRAELGKVTWPSRDELVKATRMVVILSVVVGVVLGILDLLLTKLLIEGVAALGR
ncbi:MAG: preprotein translocase subunit SecE [Gemmatimonadales bacterium]